MAQVTWNDLTPVQQQTVRNNLRNEGKAFNMENINAEIQRMLTTPTTPRNNEHEIKMGGSDPTDEELLAANQQKKAPKTGVPTFNLNTELGKLNKTKESADTIEMQIIAETTRQNTLAELKKVDLESLKNAGNTDSDIKNQGAISLRFVEVAINGKKANGKDPESLKNIAASKLTADQKNTLGDGIATIANMSRDELASQFGVNLADLDSLTNLPEDATEEQVKEIVTKLNGVLDQIQKGTQAAEQRQAAADKTIADNNRTLEGLFRKRETEKSRYKGEEPWNDSMFSQAADIEKLQKANVDALKEVALCQSFKALAGVVKTAVDEKAAPFKAGNETLDNVAQFQEAAGVRLADQTKAEDKADKLADKAVDKAEVKFDKAGKRITKAKDRDKDWVAHDDSDNAVNEKVSKRIIKFNVADQALKDADKEAAATQAVLDRRVAAQVRLDALRNPEPVDETTP